MVGMLQVVAVVFYFVFHFLMGWFVAVEHDRPQPQVQNGSEWIGDPPIAPESYLRLPLGSSFKIAIFADLHFGENAWTNWGPLQDLNSIKVMSTILELEHPDFVVYLGDVITANNILVTNATYYWEQAVSPARTRGIPWAIVFGNHDDAPFEWPMEWFSATGIPPLLCPMTNSSSEKENCRFKNIDRLELMEHEIGHSMLSHSKMGPMDLFPSVSNYFLSVSSEENHSILTFLYFLDSGGGSYPEVISSSQAKWFKNKSNEINPDSRIPEVIFWHIPSKAYKKVAPRFRIRRPCVGSINKEKVSEQEAEMGIMKYILDRPSIKAVFVGHNHGLDWCCPYKKLWLCFARHTGYGGYGNWLRGSRIITMTQQPFSVKSWIRMEDGSIHSDVLLHS